MSQITPLPDNHPLKGTALDPVLCWELLVANAMPRLAMTRPRPSDYLGADWEQRFRETASRRRVAPSAEDVVVDRIAAAIKRNDQFIKCPTGSCVGPFTLLHVDRICASCSDIGCRIVGEGWDRTIFWWNKP